MGSGGKRRRGKEGPGQNSTRQRPLNGPAFGSSRTLSARPRNCSMSPSAGRQTRTRHPSGTGTCCSPRVHPGVLKSHSATSGALGVLQPKAANLTDNDAVLQCSEICRALGGPLSSFPEDHCPGEGTPPPPAGISKPVAMVRALFQQRRRTEATKITENSFDGFLLLLIPPT